MEEDEEVVNKDDVTVNDLIINNSSEVNKEIEVHLNKQNSNLFKKKKKQLQPKRTLLDIITNGHKESEISLVSTESSSKFNEEEEEGNEVEDDWFHSVKVQRKDLVRLKIVRKIKKIMVGSSESDEVITTTRTSNLRINTNFVNSNTNLSQFQSSSNSPSTSVESFSTIATSPLSVEPNSQLSATTTQFQNLLLTPIISSTSSISSTTPTPSRTLTINKTGRKSKFRRSRLPTIKKKFGKLLSNFTTKSEILLDDEEEGSEIPYVYESLYENQRGLFLFGARFSSSALTQLDPTTFSDELGHNSPFTPTSFPLPPFHKWDQSNWLIDLGGDVDENGWSYSYIFHSNHWTGEPSLWFSFVRRRRWIRGRIYISPLLQLSQSQSIHSSKTPIKIDWSPATVIETPSEGSSNLYESKDDIKKPTTRGLKEACSCLPLSSRKKDEIFNWSRLDVELCSANPFLSFQWVKKEGAKIIEHITEERINIRLERKEKGLDLNGGSNLEKSEDLLLGVWRDSVMEINFRRVSRVLTKFCRNDREKLDLWKSWFSINEGGAEEVEDRPNLEDVWTLVEGRLDELLHQFEFQSNKLSFLELITSLHHSTHYQHLYKDYDQGRVIPKILEPNGNEVGEGKEINLRLGFWEDVEKLRLGLEVG